MNREYEEIVDLLQEIISLLKDNDEQNWSGILAFLKNMLPEDPEGARIKISSVFGGMGSFTDLVLHKNGVPLVKENNKLDTLRRSLFMKIKFMRTT